MLGSCWQRNPIGRPMTTKKDTTGRRAADLTYRKMVKKLTAMEMFADLNAKKIMFLLGKEN